MKDDAKSLIKKFSGFSIGPILSALMSFLLVPITSWFIVPEEFGKASMYTVALSFTTSIIFLGMDSAFVREYNGDKNKKQLLLNCFSVPLIISIIIGLISITFSNEISILLFDTQEKFIMIIFAFSLPLTIFQSFNKILVRVQEKGVLFSIILILERLIAFIILMLMIRFFDRGFKGIILADFITILIISCINFFVNKKYWLSRFTFNKEIIWKALQYGLPLVPTMILTWVLSSMDKIALKTWSDFAELGLYSVALRIVSTIDIFKTSFVTFWSPIAYRWYENKVDNERFVRVMNLITSLACIAFGVVIISKNYIILIFNKSYLNASSMVPFLLFIPVTEIIVQVTSKGISFSRKTGYYVLASIIAALSNYIGNYLLVPKYGGVGATISTGISYIIFFWARTLISRRLWFRFGISKLFLCMSVILAMAISSVIFNKLIFDIMFFIILLILVRKDLLYIYNLLKGFNLSFLPNNKSKQSAVFNESD